MAGSTTSTTTLTLHTGATLWRGKGSLQAGRRLSQLSLGSTMLITSTRGHSIVTPVHQGVASVLNCCIFFSTLAFFVYASVPLSSFEYHCFLKYSNDKLTSNSPCWYASHKYSVVSVFSSVPRYDQPPPLPPPVTYQPRPTERNQPVLVPANPYHTAEIPDWLQVYARAPLK